MLKVECNLCRIALVGPIRSDKEDFPPGVEEKFFQDVAEYGFVETQDGWSCGDKCSGLFPNVDLKDFKIPKGFKFKPINPDYFSVVTITNL